VEESVDLVCDNSSNDNGSDEAGSVRFGVVVSVRGETRQGSV